MRRLGAALLLASALAGGCDDGADARPPANVSVGPQVFAGAASETPELPAPAGQPPTEREALLGWALALIAALGTASFLLSGRVGPTVHVALSLLCVLVAAFALYVLLSSSSALGAPLAATAALLALLGLLKLMSRFETLLGPRRGGPGARG